MTWTRERWSAIEAAFLEVAEAEASERASVLEAVCGGDDDLRCEVLRMLAADAGGADGLLDAGIGTALRGHDPLIGQRFGAFELIERIAEGGMGAVYRAERRGGDFEQQAAVKVLRLGLSTAVMRERFARERRALARLVHPNVARLYDGGTTESDVPYIAMELVDGVPIDRFCDQRHATVRERLALFVTVCRAVEFAHRSLIAHLDLKPGNILVDENGVPKLVDFGVAALLQAGGEGEPAGAVAVTRGRPLTPEYASPELLRGDPVTTAADVWALGAVLHELLTGTRAFRPTGSDFALARTVCETDAVRPSERFAAEADAADRAALRSASAPELQRALRGDLDRIVQKAMRRDPRERYASCRDLADDIERHLAGFPVAAREPSFGYRARRFVRRHRFAVAAVSAVLIALVGGLVATSHLAQVARAERRQAEVARDREQHQARVARAERRAAEAARDRATAAGERALRQASHASIEAMSNHLVAEFLSDTFLSAQFLGESGQREAALATIHRKAEQVRRQHAGDPHLGANLLHALGRATLRLGEFEAALALLQEAADWRRNHFGAESLEYALSLGALGQLHYAAGRFREAAEALREAHRLHRECPSDVHTDVALAANDLAAAERALGNRARARELHLEALELRRAGGQPALVAESLNNLANSEPDLERARAHLEEALQLRTDVLGADDPLTIQSTTNLAAVCLRLGDFARARALADAAIARSRNLAELGGEALAFALRLSAVAECALGDLAAALAAIDESLALDRERLGAAHVALAAPLEARATILERSGRFGDAAQHWREVLDLRSRTLPRGHRLLVTIRASLGAALVRAGDVETGVVELRAAASQFDAAGIGGAERVDLAVLWALAELAAGDAAAAERILRDALRWCTDDPAAAPRRPVVEGHLREFDSVGGAR